ncbi:hypothetical protein TPHA_0E00260 [Tetrapisispora phaffii CBS 4417]|uniref:Pantoate--beta-alanine ligase n=1 Tax=Tetrapisispora phaffii (strain ATCC 24235 / CBS 4417 / NBRC 1672 / NRRL Y-8282 / UCD 70-5) TaxID=1071381 RepID=G8BT94_TETPH|nr:hypothetical protein TPHA_0E00260 [Tetrapisispora phaffii CBS 4417]CCE63122.1 hypothetical protein TPHA_0E00260 [Tetrapisispora phaffii CBS 4417]
MKTFNKVADVIQWRKNEIGCREKVTIGFVPTMGCLHQGHATLIRNSKKENDFTVVSIFVNPSQFAPDEDLDQYPRTMENDVKLLESLGVDALFAPTAKELYPQGIPLDVEKQHGPFVTVLGISEMLEGTTRPNFFRGVATVVMKLLNIVSPDFAYFGQKDIQQFKVLDVMVNELFMNTKLILVPIVRNADGLALSSRNKYLCDETLELSTNIFKGLNDASEKLKLIDLGESLSHSKITSTVLDIWKPLIESGDFNVDYLSFAKWDTLQELENITSEDVKAKIVISCAVYVTDRHDKSTVVRLIDNIICQ